MQTINNRITVTNSSAQSIYVYECFPYESNPYGTGYEMYTEPLVQGANYVYHGQAGQFRIQNRQGNFPVVNYAQPNGDRAIVNTDGSHQLLITLQDGFPVKRVLAVVNKANGYDNITVTDTDIAASQTAAKFLQVITAFPNSQMSVDYWLKMLDLINNPAVPFDIDLAGFAAQYNYPGLTANAVALVLSFYNNYPLFLAGDTDKTYYLYSGDGEATIYHGTIKAVNNNLFKAYKAVEFTYTDTANKSYSISQYFQDGLLSFNYSGAGLSCNLRFIFYYKKDLTGLDGDNCIAPALVGALNDTTVMAIETPPSADLLSTTPSVSLKSVVPPAQVSLTATNDDNNDNNSGDDGNKDKSGSSGKSWDDGAGDKVDKNFNTQPWVMFFIGIGGVLCTLDFGKRIFEYFFKKEVTNEDLKKQIEELKNEMGEKVKGVQDKVDANHEKLGTVEQDVTDLKTTTRNIDGNVTDMPSTIKTYTDNVQQANADAMTTFTEGKFKTLDAKINLLMDYGNTPVLQALDKQTVDLKTKLDDANAAKVNSQKELEAKLESLNKTLAETNKSLADIATQTKTEGDKLAESASTEDKAAIDDTVAEVEEISEEAEKEATDAEAAGEHEHTPIPDRVAVTE